MCDYVHSFNKMTIMYVFWKYCDFNVLFIGLTKNCHFISFRKEKRQGKNVLSNEKNKKFWIKKDNKTLTTLVSTNIILSPSQKSAFFKEVI